MKQRHVDQLRSAEYVYPALTPILTLPVHADQMGSWCDKTCICCEKAQNTQK